MIVIIDYDAGNIGSLKNMLKKLGHDSQLTSDVSTIEAAEKIILPGVGSFDHGMSKLHDLGLSEVLNKKKDAGTPILGICLGAQLMCLSSEEGKMEGLKWINANVVRFPGIVDSKKLLVPHIGWDEVQSQKESRLFDSMPNAARFYFVHSYHIRCNVEMDSLAQNRYGVLYDSAFEKANVVGVQFHPEKSHRYGKQLLQNFVENY
ncbi:MAG: imidazole glycerol phosphate synthase subunit HisH [Bacteroidota bacterium]